MHKDGILTFILYPDPEIPDLKKLMRARNAVWRQKRYIGNRGFMGLLVSTCAFWTQHSCIGILVLSTFVHRWLKVRLFCSPHCLQDGFTKHTHDMETVLVPRLPIYRLCLQTAFRARMSIVKSGISGSGCRWQRCVALEFEALFFVKNLQDGHGNMQRLNAWCRFRK